jgi:hypothetical protein
MKWKWEQRGADVMTILKAHEKLSNAFSSLSIEACLEISVLIRSCLDHKYGPHVEIVGWKDGHHSRFMCQQQKQQKIANDYHLI